MSDKRNNNHNGKRKPGQNRGSKQKLIHRKILTESIVRGDFLPDVAEELGISLVTLYADIKKLKKEWAEETRESTELVILGELNKLRLMEDEAWKAWGKDTKTKTKVTETSQGITVSKEIEKLNGDPRYLMTIQNCMRQRAELMGLIDKDVNSGKTMDERALEIRDALAAIESGVPKQNDDDN